jgi:hypothetical protein
MRCRLTGRAKWVMTSQAPRRWSARRASAQPTLVRITARGKTRFTRYLRPLPRTKRSACVRMSHVPSDAESLIAYHRDDLDRDYLDGYATTSTDTRLPRRSQGAYSHHPTHDQPDLKCPGLPRPTPVSESIMMRAESVGQPTIRTRSRRDSGIEGRVPRPCRRRNGLRHEVGAQSRSGRVARSAHKLTNALNQS